MEAIHSIIRLLLHQLKQLFCLRDDFSGLTCIKKSILEINAPVHLKKYEQMWKKFS